MNAAVVGALAIASVASASSLPTVIMHGMGDSCFSPGMTKITEAIGKHLEGYSVCIPIGDNTLSDKKNSFFMSMSDNVDEFAKRVRADSNLKNGFNAVGFSSGNLVIRGYAQKYMDPPVSTVLSVHGPLMGAAGFPNCNPGGLLGPVCKLLAEKSGDEAYEESVQNELFPLDYFRDPMRLNDPKFKKNSEIAQWNNEGNTVDEKMKAHFGKVDAWVMVKAKGDTVMSPPESAWWGFFAEGSSSHVLPMKETRSYKEDLFGLKTADEAHKLHFESTPGDHLEVKEAELFGWLDKYFKKRLV